MKTIKQIVALILTLLIGLFFIWSAWVKIDSIVVYEITLVKQGLATWSTSRFITRVFLAIELSIGLLLIFQYRLKKITFPITISFITLMTLFLIGRFIFIGDDDDCGCFGEVLKFSTKESILKNIAISIILFILWKSNTIINFERWNYKKSLSILFFVTLTSIIIYQPPVNIYGELSVDSFKPNDAFPKIDSLPSEVYEGKSIVAFFSPNCSHCKHAAIKLKVMDGQGSDYKIYPVFGFGKESIGSFMDEVELKTPYILISKNDFLTLTEGIFPQIYVLEDGGIRFILNKRQFIKNDF